MEEQVETIWGKLPEDIAALLGPQDAITPVRARLGNDIWLVTTKGEGTAVLKVGQSRAAQDMRNEVERLTWLRDQLAIPQILAHQAVGETEFVLMTLLKGSPAHLAVNSLNPDAVLKRFAQYLRGVHSVPVEICPFGPVVGSELATARAILASDAIDRVGFVDKVGSEPERVLSRLEDMRAVVNETAFTHGDYCLPNLIVDIGGADGGLDWGQAGISDIHRDFMSAELTISKNFGKEYIDIFYEHYGVDNLDRSRVELFWLLDQFSNYRIV